METPYISRVQIKNYRNFKNVDVDLSHKQVVLGENNCGKTNFLRAIQLILDSSFSDNDRVLLESDFHDSIDAPMKNGEEIEISIEIRGYEKNNQLVAKFQDAVINDNPPTLKFTYRFFPERDENGLISHYEYEIFMGISSDNIFNPTHRTYINIKVIKALRDVEREMKSLKKSPVYQLVEQFNIPSERLEDIAKELQIASDSIMKLDEIKELKKIVEKKFVSLSGSQPDSDIDLSTFDIDPNRLLYTLQILLGDRRRPVSEISLGLCNILYISLMLLLIRDKTVPQIIKEDVWDIMLDKDPELLKLYYDKSELNNYILKDGLNAIEYEELYSFMSKNNFQRQTFTILAVEEPEAHLHPVLQRLIYREVLHKSDTSVIFTTHSTHLTSVAPIETIVHVKSDLERVSNVLSAANINLENNNRFDIERYLDARRGEIYFGAGIIFVEGISEEYLIPKFAEVLGYSLDSLRIVICNINSTNFSPYVSLVNKLGIPWCIVTDGDYYVTTEKGRKIFHIINYDGDDLRSHDYLGNKIVNKLLVRQKVLAEEDIPEDEHEQDQLFSKYGCFVGHYTFEVDIMETQGEDGKAIFKKVFSEVRPGGPKQQANFDKVIDADEYYKTLEKIEAPGIGKGRFAQRLASQSIAEQIPEYVKNAILYIISKVKQDHD
jgi:putative ATP-dependent endonuclease of OLD family